jgi:transcriptional regulator with XRE-family HTH domain
MEMNKETNAEIAKSLRQQWQAKKGGLSLKDLSKKMGLSYATVKRHMNGTSSIGVAQVIGYADALGIPANTILQGTESPAQSLESPQIKVNLLRIQQVAKMIEDIAAQAENPWSNLRKYDHFIRVYVRQENSRGTSNLRSDLTNAIDDYYREGISNYDEPGEP